MAQYNCRLVATRENHVYEVSSGQQRWALRQHRQGLRTRQQLLSELVWMQALAADGINVPRPLASNTGELVETINDQFFSVVTWLGGTPMDAEATLSTQADRTAQYTQLGRALAQLHNASADWSPPNGFERPAWDRGGLIGEEPLWGRFWDAPFLSAQDANLFQAARSVIDQELAKANLPVRLIHADLVPENVLIQDNGLAVIDFDDCAWGYWAFDIATVVNRAQKSAQADHLVNALIDAYKQEGPDTLACLPVLQAARALSYVGWIVPRLTEPGGPQRLARFLTTARTMANRIL